MKIRANSSDSFGYVSFFGGEKKMISAKWTLMRPHVVKLRPSVRSSSLFTSRRTAMLETEANADPDNRNGKQSALFEQLLRSGKYTTVISKFETGDPELQADHDCLKLVSRSFCNRHPVHYGSCSRRPVYKDCRAGSTQTIFVVTKTALPKPIRPYHS